MKDTCQVLLLYPGKGIFDYLVEKKINIGQIVSAPLRNNNYYGVVIGKGSNLIDRKKLRTIVIHEKFPPLSIELLNFCYWLSEWCMYHNSLVTRLTIPSLNFLKISKNKIVLVINNKNLELMTDLGLKTYKYIKKYPGYTINKYCEILNVSNSVIKKLIKDNNIAAIDANQFKIMKAKKLLFEKVNLNEHQLKVIQKINKNFNKNKIFLLDGVTGSGKTEVYIDIIKKELSQNKQCLILLPEIALTSQLLRKFEQRSGIIPWVWHSEMSIKDRRECWHEILNGKAKVVVGARSALFLPFKSLSCIVVDEEHDSSYKQDDGVIYNARDMAVVRGQLSNALVILSSATPSLESLNNVKLGKYIKLDLPKRYGRSLIPSIKLIDMRKTKLKKGYWISDIARDVIKKAIASKEQVLLFLNRRGYSPLTICNSCGYRLQCVHCSAWLVHHKKTGILKCHYCGYSEIVSTSCDKCGEKDSFVPYGPGVERLAEEVEKLFPDTKNQIITSDTFDKKIGDKILNNIIKGDINIIIGTQLVAKGHHFPLLNTVIAIDADLGLFGSDLRTSERTFQLFTQLSGRAGRETQKGIAYIQTFDPNNDVMQAIVSGDKNKFVDVELANRYSRSLPPFGRLASLIVQAKNLNELQIYLKLMSKSIPKTDNGRIVVLGPVPAPIEKLRDWHRYRYLIKGDINIRLQPYIKKWMSKIKVNRAIRVKIDIDPYNFM